MTLLLIWWSLLLQVASGSKSTEEPPAAASGLFRQPACLNRCTAVVTALELLIALTLTSSLLFVFINSDLFWILSLYSNS